MHIELAECRRDISVKSPCTLPTATILYLADMDRHWISMHLVPCQSPDFTLSQLLFKLVPNFRLVARQLVCGKNKLQPPIAKCFSCQLIKKV